MKNAAPTHRDSIAAPAPRGGNPITAVAMDSSTESEEEGPLIAPAKPGTHEFHPTANSEHAESLSQSANVSKGTSPAPSGAQSRSVSNLTPSSDADSSPVRPAKKAKPSTSSSSEDSEEERKKLVDKIRSGAAPKRGARQPLRRGGKRF